MKLLDFSDDILRQVFEFLEFKELHAIGPLSVTMKMLGIRLESARWVLHHHQYIPFEFRSSRFRASNDLSITGRVYSPSYREWINDHTICSSPWEYKMVFRNEATPDMVPRIIPHNDPRLKITYQGRRKSPRRRTFQQGQEVDVMDSHGVWWKGSMVECNENLIRYHFHGWESRWDLWYPDDSLHVAPLYSITQDWMSTLQIGDSVDVKKGGSWFSGVLCEIMPTIAIVNVNHEREVIELPSERLMFHAHIYIWSTSSFLTKNPIWRDREGVDIYQYRMQNITFLTDHVLTDAEIKHRLKN
jgi:hypothetical protein